MYKRAILDSNLLLVGFDEVEALTPGDVDGGDGDLKLREYKWDTIGQTFVPLDDPRKVLTTRGAPDIDAIIADLLSSFEKAGFHLTPIMRNYLLWYRQTVDGIQQKHIGQA